MYRYSQQMRQNNANIRLWNRILAVVAILALVGCGALGVRLSQASSLNEKTRQQLLSRVRSCCTEGKTTAEKMATSLQSNTSIQLANIQQCVYAMEQINNVSMSLYGESGRLVPQEALTALYEDLSGYFSVIQTNTVSVLEIRTLLINHLTALQEVLMAE